MTANYSRGITTPADDRAKSRSHLEAAKVARLALEDAYASSRQDRALIAELHQQIGFALKLAEIHALLALAPEPSTPGSQSQVPVREYL